MTVIDRSLLAVVVAFLFLAGQTCVLPAHGSSTPIDEHSHGHVAHSAAPAPGSPDGHDHEHAPGMSAHCVDSAVGHTSASRASVVVTILVRHAPVAFLPEAAARALDAPADVGGPPLFLLHAALLI
jgi:hypothetical protein